MLFKIISFLVFSLFIVSVVGSEPTPERKLDEAITEIHSIMSNKAFDSGTKKRRIKLVASRLLEKQLIMRHEEDLNKLDEKIAIEVVSRSPRRGCTCFYREIRIWESPGISRLYGIIFRFRLQNGNWQVYEIS